MGDQRALAAVERIEQALARIEETMQRPSSPQPAVDSEAFERLRIAHDTLRRRVAGAIGQIDQLLETGDR